MALDKPSRGRFGRFVATLLLVVSSMDVSRSGTTQETAQAPLDALGRYFYRQQLGYFSVHPFPQHIVPHPDRLRCPA
uniref:Putative secreted protein n=1 Tax=Anopheles darlingi TaxID=43151 RepID=A0A2M4DQ93_ANODA